MSYCNFLYFVVMENIHIFYVGWVMFIVICFKLISKQIDFNGAKVWKELKTGQNWCHKQDFQNSNWFHEYLPAKPSLWSSASSAKFEHFFSWWMKFLLPFVIFHWDLLSANNKYLHDYTKRRCTKYKLINFGLTQRNLFSN